MSRLLVNPGTPQAWEIHLKHGTNRLGRGAQNDFQVDHPTVSTAHCEIITSSAGVLLKDLASTNGTFINRASVHEALLQPGQHVQIGSVDMLFESDVPLPPALPPGEAAFCKFHPRTQARFLCHTCQKYFCDMCVATRETESGAKKLCRTCGSECAPVHLHVVHPAPQKGFFTQLSRAFAYPVKGNGGVLLVAGTVFFLFLDYVSSMASRMGPYGGVGAGLVGILGAGYLFSYAKRIITSTADGEAEPPDWPDFSDWREDILMPFGQLVALAALTFGPAMILRWWQPGSETFAHAAVIAATVIGALLAPMGMLALAMFDSVSALNPVALGWSILRIPRHYLAAAAAFELVIGVSLFAKEMIASSLPVPLLPGLFSGLLNLYLIAVSTRILGLLYLAKRKELGWFPTR